MQLTHAAEDVAVTKVEYDPAAQLRHAADDVADIDDE